MRREGYNSRPLAIEWCGKPYLVQGRVVTAMQWRSAAHDHIGNSMAR